MPRPILLTVSRKALSHNLNTVINGLKRSNTNSNNPGIKVWAVIKANAYGHGIEPAVEAFEQANGLGMLDLDEAIRCRQAGWTKPILLLEGFFHESDLSIVQEYDLTIAVHCTHQLEMINKASLLKPLNVFLKLNCGMNRLGFMPEEYAKAWEYAAMLRSNGKIDTLGKMTHFSRADDDPNETQQQLELFKRVAGQFPGPVSLCNSAATLSPQVWSGINENTEQWVRPGICLYGGTPFADRDANSLGLLPAQTLKASILAVRDLKAGASIGYGHQFTATENVRMGVVSCGYADGYPRLAGTGTPITVHGKRTRLLGRVSMDMMVADLTHIPEAGPGSEVVLWGQGGPAIDEVAAHAQTIGYELMCAVATRVPRVII